MVVMTGAGSTDAVKELVPAAVVVGGRKAWQDFKKAHPDFARGKSLKLDLGPSIDQYEKAMTSFSKEKDAFQKRLDVELTHVGAALSAYRVVVEHANNSAMKRDFDKVSGFFTGPVAPDRWRRS